MNAQKARVSLSHSLIVCKLGPCVLKLVFVVLLDNHHHYYLYYYHLRQEVRDMEIPTTAELKRNLELARETLAAVVATGKAEGWHQANAAVVSAQSRLFARTSTAHQVNRPRCSSPGCTMPASMSASMGRACPDHYDELS